MSEAVEGSVQHSTANAKAAPAVPMILCTLAACPAAREDTNSLLRIYYRYNKTKIKGVPLTLQLPADSFDLCRGSRTSNIMRGSRSIGLICWLQCAVHVSVASALDWSAFLARHDMTW